MIPKFLLAVTLIAAQMAGQSLCPCQMAGAATRSFGAESVTFAESLNRDAHCPADCDHGHGDDHPPDCHCHDGKPVCIAGRTDNDFGYGLRVALTGSALPLMQRAASLGCTLATAGFRVSGGPTAARALLGCWVI
jgi:hypothetical protein